MNFSERFWERFWFAPTSLATLGVVRIAYGVIMFFWGLAIAPDSLSFFSTPGVLPEHPETGLRWGLLALWDADIAVVLIIGLLLAVRGVSRARLPIAVRRVGCLGRADLAHATGSVRVQLGRRVAAQHRTLPRARPVG